MRIEKVVVVLAVSLAAGTAQAASVCGLASGKSLTTYQDSVAAAGANQPMAAALDQIYSFPDIKGLLAGNPGKVCVTAIPMSKNIYQYYKYLVVFAFGESHKSAVAPMIFQAASVQAYENLASKPWLGFSRDRFARDTAALLAGAEFSEGNKSVSSPVDLLPALFPGSEKQLDPTSRAFVLLPDADPAWTTYLVSQLRFVDTGNPFTSQYIQDIGVVQMSEASGRTRWAALSGFFNAASALEDLQWSSAPKGGAAERKSRLIELSRGAAGRAPATTVTLDGAGRGMPWE